jgi:hypothetical protein
MQLSPFRLRSPHRSEHWRWEHPDCRFGSVSSRHSMPIDFWSIRCPPETIRNRNVTNETIRKKLKGETRTRLTLREFSSRTPIMREV